MRADVACALRAVGGSSRAGESQHADEFMLQSGAVDSNTAIP